MMTYNKRIVEKKSWKDWEIRIVWMKLVKTQSTTNKIAISDDVEETCQLWKLAIVEKVTNFEERDLQIKKGNL